MLELIFIIFVAIMITIEWAYHREHPSTFNSALAFTGAYIGAAFIFSGVVAGLRGHEAAGMFLMGYTLEKMLAFDNLFVFSIILTYFKIGALEKHKALHYGIIGAAVFRLIFTVIGVEFMEYFGPTFDLVFAAMILYSVYLMMSASDEDDATNYDELWWVINIRKVFPTISIFWLVVIIIEISDVLFAFDSVPAVIAVTKDPALIYFAMMFAILGLRQMYFVIDAMKNYMRYIDTAIYCILVFIAIKLVASGLFAFHMNELYSLAIVATILLIGATASLANPKES
ncbi:MAG: hypothetical protein COB09_18795 [Thalassobium sp.]|nr:MAG: hypothetical protein COB09_18795 [Thalassobium sp.]